MNKKIIYATGQWFMKKPFIIIFIICLILTSCLKENDFGQRGVITGFDYRKCYCCGGWFININDSIYRFKNLPEHNNINLDNASYPIEVFIKWKKDPHACLDDEIIIMRIGKF
jgi:hypothetical protein